MADNSLNISIPVKFEIKTPPRGMTDYDPKALSAEQQIEMNTYKLKVRKDNLLYLAEHPEVRAVVAYVGRKTMARKPQNIVKFVAELFTRPEREVREEIRKILDERPLEYGPIPYVEYEEWDY